MESVTHAAALIAGFDPNSVDESGNWFKDPGNRSYGQRRLTWVQTAFVALVNAVNARKLKATVRRPAWQRGWDEEPEEGEAYAQKDTIRDDDAAHAWGIAEPHAVRARSIIYRVTPDWKLTTVTVDDVRGWLASRGVKTGFFFRDATDAPDYLNPKHPRYAPGLAAAVNAWVRCHAGQRQEREGCNQEVFAWARGGVWFGQWGWQPERDRYRWSRQGRQLATDGRCAEDPGQ
jgi:hypothetical protein